MGSRFKLRAAACAAALLVVTSACGDDGPDGQTGVEQFVEQSGYELSAHEAALDDDPAVWFTIFGADEMEIEAGAAADTLRLTLTGFDANITQFLDIPAPHHGIDVEDVDRTVHRVPSAEVFEKWNMLEEASNESVTLHAPNAGVTMHDDAGERHSLVLSLDDLVEFDDDTVVFEVQSLPGESVELGAFVDVSLMVDGWTDVAVWCTLAVVIDVAAAMATVLTAGAAAALAVAVIGVNYNCVKAISSVIPGWTIK